MGVAAVVGDPGTGKDLLSNYLTYRLKRYFLWKRILRDEKPRPLYGPYAGLFNPEVLAQDIERMKKIASGDHTSAHYGIALDKAATDWVTEEGPVLLKNSVLYLTEYWRYCYNREPHNPMNKILGGVHKMKRHLDVLILGTVQLVSDLDKKTCKPFIDWRITCQSRSRVNKTLFSYLVEKVKYDRRRDVLTPISDPFQIRIDGGKPRSYMGDGKIVIKKPGYEPMNEEERVVLMALKSGIDNYEKLVDVLETEGDMEERETLETLKVLKFNRLRRVIDYPCDFGVYNSKSSPQLKGSKRLQE